MRFSLVPLSKENMAVMRLFFFSNQVWRWHHHELVFMVSFQEVLLAI